MRVTDTGDLDMDKLAVRGGLVIVSRSYLCQEKGNVPVPKSLLPGRMARAAPTNRRAIIFATFIAFGASFEFTFTLVITTKFFLGTGGKYYCQ